VFTTNREVSKMSPTERLAYTVADAKAATGLGTTKIYELLAAGRLQAVKAGRRTLVTGDSLRAYIASLPPAHLRTGLRKNEAEATAV
jgi:excisionase family DNA binding protein